ncbi:unnamed protein product [Chondrus crispus]|uniref:rRNA adenine N(6)-methyltransferase n=1 Tax=Chondrus crispus TaxID=2769 RepID=R7Q4T4_CHOCR|nr:unnamed protein product [Chondrus crispus]CDF33004.1 unnamed protein product [Chondrus crispus]|eukprot:XP_005712807.1 unnamed protein product [Chondrus crispus]
MTAVSRLAFQLAVRPPLSSSLLHQRALPTCRRPAAPRRRHGTRRQAPSASYGTEGDAQAWSGFRTSGIRPKQSLGQNFLRDGNMVSRIVQSFGAAVDELCPDAHVVEVGPGLGALTTRLVERYPDMLAIEIDRRAVQYLHENFDGLAVRHGDVLETDWPGVAAEVAKPLAVIGNLPYNIVSQILFSLLEAPSGTIGVAVVMMQKEVAERIAAKTRTKAYGILSVVAQLYAKPRMLFKVPNTVFYPQPDVTSALVQFEFQLDECLDVRNTTLTRGLRTVVRTAFNQRRKVLRNSLRTLCEEKGVQLPDKWARKRAEEVPPPEFVEMTRFLFEKELETPELVPLSDRPTTVWR